jgi:hypothetical protein
MTFRAPPCMYVRVHTYVCIYVNADLFSETLWFILNWYISSAVVEITA